MHQIMTNFSQNPLEFIKQWIFMKKIAFIKAYYLQMSFIKTTFLIASKKLSKIFYQSCNFKKLKVKGNNPITHCDKLNTCFFFSKIVLLEISKIVLLENEVGIFIKQNFLEIVKNHFPWLFLSIRYQPFSYKSFWNQPAPYKSK